MLQHVIFTDSEKSHVIKTARFSGAVGQNAIVPKIARNFVVTGIEQILDFGCGSKRLHVEALWDEGYNVCGYDFSLPETYWMLSRRWDIIYASNVLNIQSDLSMLRRTLQQIRDIMRLPDGVFICNYPQPRHIPINPAEIEQELELFFAVVDRYPAQGHHIWVCRNNDPDRVVH